MTEATRLGCRLLAIGALQVLLVVAAACSRGSPSPPPPSLTQATAAASPAAQNQARGSPTGAASPATPTPLVPPSNSGQVLYQQDGGDSTGQTCCTVGQRTATFTAPGSWDLHWQFDCSSSRQGNLGIDVFTGNGSYVSDPRSLLAIGPAGQGIQEFGVAGAFYLVLNSVCHWSVTVAAAVRPTATPVSSNSGPVPTAAPVVAAGFVPATVAAVATVAATTSSRSGSPALAPAIGPSIATAIRPAFNPAIATAAGSGLRGSGASAGPAVIPPASVATAAATPSR